MMGKFRIGNCEKTEREAGEEGEKINHRVMSDEKIPGILQYLEFSTFQTFPGTRGHFSRGSHAGFRAI